MADKQTDRGIQLLRIAACFGVFFGHFGMIFDFEKISADLYTFSYSGRYAVELFFVISGYLACFSLSTGQTIGQFYKKKFIRIFPLYYFCILCHFAIETFICRSVPEDPMHLGWLRYIFCLNGIIPSEGYVWGNVGITWTIPVFVMFYLVAPFIIKNTKSTFSSTVILIITVSISYIIQTRMWGWFSAFSYLPCFLMGIVVYFAKKEQHRFVVALGFLLFVFFTKFCVWNGYTLNSLVNLFTPFIASAFFAIIILVSDDFFVGDRKNKKLLDILDEHSYTLYLVHGITFCGIIDKIDADAFSNTGSVIALKLFVSIVGTFVLTVIVHRYIEVPIQKRLSKKLLVHS